MIGYRLGLAFLLALPLLGQSRLADLPVLPDDRLTPGVIAETDVSKVCVSGYSKTVRHTSGKLKARVYREYGITTHRTGDFEIDHRIPLSLGGADTLKNLWSESYNTPRWNAYTKDRLEGFLHQKACAERSMSLSDAQAVFLGNWISAYRRYVGER